MPLSGSNKTEYQRNYMREKRKQKGVTGEGVTTVPASYVEGTHKSYEFLPERPRYVTLSDGQVLDRLNQPVMDRESVPMAACNDTYFADLGRNRAERLAILHNKI